MRTHNLKTILLSCIFVLSCLAAHAVSTTGFTNGYWWQAAGYAGLGNQNEMLAFAEFKIPDGQTDVTVKFKLQGAYGKFVTRVCLYARKYDSSTSGNSSSISATFQQLWDYRDPVSKCGAILLSQTTGISGGEITLQGSGLESGGQYMFYVTGDIANNLENLPHIQGSTSNFTRIGAQITEITSGSTSATLVQKFSTTNGKANSDGMRVLVPQIQTLYAPADYYSKYYRIPAIVTTADGSLVAVSDARKQHIHDITNDIDMLSRRSNDNGRTWSSPITIAKGDSASKTMYETQMSSSAVKVIDCSESTGFGDASLASLPNGDLMCAFIHGYGFSQTSSSKLSNNSYVISRDNGQTWGDIKDMCDSAGTKLKMITQYRGNIAPGNLCVVKSGHLEGKVLACFRTVSDVSGKSHAGNYFVVYDPNKDAWNVLSNSSSVKYSSTNYTDSYFFYQNAATSGNGTDDEAQVIEIAENTFLMSIRSDGTYQREFALIKLNSSSSGNIYYSATPLGNCGMSLKEKANGALCKYTAVVDGQETEFLIHTVPTTQASSSANNTTRSGLSIFTAKVSDVLTGNFTWTQHQCVSDPDDELDETAQYSSITVQQNGSIGIL